MFNRDAVFAQSIKPMVAQDQIKAIVKQFDLKPAVNYSLHTTEYATLNRLHFSNIDSDVFLEEKRLVGDNWYTRPSFGHYIGLNKDNANVTVDYLIYMQAGWQTLPNPDLLEEGMEVSVFHDGEAVTDFKIDEKKVLPVQTTFVASKSEERQIILLIEDPAAKIYYGFSLVLKV